MEEAECAMDNNKVEGNNGGDNDDDNMQLIGKVPLTQSNTESPAVAATMPDFNKMATVDIKLSVLKKW